MLDSKEVQEAIDKFRKYVIQQSRSNLTKMKKNSSKALYKSIDGVSKVNPNSISLYFEMLDYGVFQDLGVKGAKSIYPESSGTKFTYRDLKPSPKHFDKWVVRKGIAPRNKQGQFIDRNSLKFAIARSIFNKGIRASMFFTKPFEKAFDRLPDEIIEAYGITLENTYFKEQ
jgi:hypothetical protein